MNDIQLGENWQGEPTIKNPEDFTALVIDHIEPSALPDGTYIEWEVENPHLNDDPRHLRVKGYRKGMTFHLIGLAESWGLKVADVWQHDDDKENDLICFKLVPQETEIRDPRDSR